MASEAARRSPWVGLAAAGALACAAGSAPPPARFDAWFPEGRQTLALEALVARVALAPGQDVRVEELGRDARTSHHLVALRHAESLHRHDRHDLIVVLLSGYGSMRMGTGDREAGQGSVFYVPRGSVHAFSNAAPEPAVAYLVYAPPFDAEDRIPVE